MRPHTWVRIRQVFERALAVPALERARFLEQACVGEPAVRAEVARLLAEDDSTAGFLEPLVAAPRPLAGGSRVGPFEIRRVLASGGMGTVYEAVQDRPHRAVALKTLRHGFDSESRRRRFELEAEVLGNLRHPGVAQIYASGTHVEAGRSFPYFAMEYVEGARDLIDYAREERSPLHARVALFAEVCDAVHHGHSKGVVHRDLKPGNVLVDREGRPKVIDFGVARTTAPELAAAAAQTREGQLVGTLHYMSPEQLTGGDVDTRSDVYSLGCLLHELLVGAPPHDLDDQPLPEVARVLAEVDPPRPRKLPRDLGWIVLRALEKDPERRYLSASELATDLRRFLRHEPVLAGPPGAGYRIGKLARRHRVLLVAAVAVALALSIGLFQARREARSATTAMRSAEREADKAEGVSEFLRAMLTSAGPLSRGVDARVLDVLDEASGAVERELAGRPDARAVVHHVLAETYTELRLFDEAAAHLAAAREYVDGLPPGDALRIDVLTTAARLTMVSGNPLDADEPLRELEELALAHLGPDHRTTLRIQGERAELFIQSGDLAQAQERYDALVDALLRTHGPVHEAVIHARGSRAIVWLRTGRGEEAATELERVLELATANLPPDHFAVLTAKLNLSGAFMQLDRLAEAEPLARDVARDVRERFGDHHAFLVMALGNVGVCLLHQGRNAEALTLFEELLPVAISTYGEENRKTEWVRGAIESARAGLARDEQQSD